MDKPQGTSTTRTNAARFNRRHVLLVGLGLYAILIALSHWNTNRLHPDMLPPDGVSVIDTRPDSPESYPIAWRTLDTPHAKSNLPPILLIHGSPGGLGNFGSLAPALAETGRQVISVDLPGFGAADHVTGLYNGSTSLSIKDHAGAVLALLDHLNIDRVHLLGWSQGGGVAIFAADADPDRIASITMLASVGLQQSEGSGSYYFEHAKYALGYVALVLAPETIPHFGLLGTFRFRHAFIRNFFDSDQRPIKRILAETSVPIVILHGRHDFLVADWGAELNHAAAPTSHLVMLPASHFLPGHELTPQYVTAHIARHDQPGIEPLTGYTDLAPVPDPTGLAIPAYWLRNTLIAAPWWIEAILIALLALRSRCITLTIAGLLVGAGWIDFGVALTGLWIGRILLAKDRIRITTWLSIIFGSAVALLLMESFGYMGWRYVYRNMGDAASVLAFLLLPILLHTLPRSFTWRSRQRLRATFAKPFRHEFWPGRIFYLPLIPYLACLSIKHRHPLVFACANPGIPKGGGIIGESKSAILDGFAGDPRILPYALIDPGTPDQRMHALNAALESIGPYPIILKPDAGQRGFAVKLIKNESQARDYLANTTGPVHAQRYSASPHEVGILWTRIPNAKSNETNGCLFSITRKDFPTITGDGAHTLGHLILAHPRHRMQADVFLARFTDAHTRIPAQDETIPLTTSGNHCQGTLFRDGADLITPELESVINDIALKYRGHNNAELDFGRFDIRYQSDEQLRAGDGLEFIELNGSTSESTNMYDPKRSLWWAYSVLFAQWRTLYSLGAWRRSQGIKPPSIKQVLRWIRAHYAERSGPPIAD